jgi:ribosomal protein L15
MRLGDNTSDNASDDIDDIDDIDDMEDIEEIIKVEQSEGIQSQRTRPLHKFEINLDVIAQKFSSGELVTLSSLKRKHLVPKKTDYVKILARGALSKPLIIEADDFSHTAEEMLRSVGGEAIRTGIDK